MEQIEPIKTIPLPSAEQRDPGLAPEGLSDEDLPEGWARAEDEDGETYFFHEDGRTQYEFPGEEEYEDEGESETQVAQAFGFVGLAALRPPTLEFPMKCREVPRTETNF